MADLKQDSTPSHGDYEQKIWDQWVQSSGICVYVFIHVKDEQGYWSKPYNFNNCFSAKEKYNIIYRAISEFGRRAGLL